MPEKCLEKMAAHGLEILLALNSSSCGILDSVHRHPARVQSKAGASKEKRISRREGGNSQDQ